MQVRLCRAGVAGSHRERLFTAGFPDGAGTLVGLDYDQLHIRRITFAREVLFGARHTIPAWYPHELLGSPFAANLQSFPWIPTCLMLLLFDPAIAYAVAVAMAAALSAIFTYLFCRRAGLTRTGAMAAGVTFACAGYFASRVMAGHLPLLEAYPALPLLLWLVDRTVARERCRRRRFDMGVLALCSAFVVLAGHPQLPAYSIAAALLYAAWRSRGWLLARTAAAITLGIGIAMAAWWPMLLLIRRSTRVLPLAAPGNDIVMPYRRLLALIIPAVQGWAQPVEAADKNPFTGYPNNAYFWDTASYVGILPLVAMAALLIGCVVQKKCPMPAGDSWRASAWERCCAHCRWQARCFTWPREHCFGARLGCFIFGHFVRLLHWAPEWTQFAAFSGGDPRSDPD